jgi:hypothetical protein
MTVELTELSVQRIAELQHKINLPEAALIEQALLFMSQNESDWEAIFENDSANHDLTEEDAFALAISEVRAYRNNKS